MPSNRFRAVVYAGTDPLTGKRRNLTETLSTHEQAEVALTKLLRQVDEQQHPKSVITDPGGPRPRRLQLTNQIVEYGRRTGRIHDDEAQ